MLRNEAPFISPIRSFISSRQEHASPAFAAERRQMNLSIRLALLSLAWLMVGLGIVGIFLPLLPTTPFLLLAAWLFSRSSPRLAKWLMDHPLFGPPLRDWREGGAISRRAKISAVLLMSLALIYLWVAFEPPAIALLVVTGIMFICGAFIVSRPEPPNKP